MNDRAGSPAVYELRVEGHLDGHWASWLGRLTANHHDDGTTTFVTQVRDQAQLHAVLAALRDIGATLVSLRPVEETGL